MDIGDCHWCDKPAVMSINALAACMEHIDTAVDSVSAPIHKLLKGLEESHGPE